MEDREVRYLVSRLVYGDSFFMSGPAGVGKSYMTNKIVQTAKDENFNVAVTSSTGVSAILIGGTTLHRLLRFGIDSRKENLIKFVKSSFFRTVVGPHLKNLDLIVVDEVSMTVKGMVDALDFLLKIAKKSEMPFGGCGILFVGDLLQCAPVNKEKLANIWCFHSEAWQKAKTKLILLEKVHRQSDPVFIHLLHSIRMGIVDKKCEEILKTLDKPLFDDAPLFVGTNHEARSFNEDRLNEIDSSMIRSLAMISGKDQRAMDSLKDNVIAEEELLFKVGCRVIMIKNDPNAGYFNGAMATVMGLKNSEYVYIKLDGKNEVIEVEKHDWELKDLNDKVTARFRQFPFKPAYAITVEKSQGMTLERANFDCKNVFTPGKFYTGISRVKTIGGLRVKNFDKKVVKVDPSAIAYYKNNQNHMEEIVLESQKNFTMPEKSYKECSRIKEKKKRKNSIKSTISNLLDL